MATLLRKLTRALGNAEEAEEVLQQTFEKALGRVDTLRAQQSAVAWFTRLVKNATVDHLRRVAARERAHRDYAVAGSTRSRAFRASFPCRASNVKKSRTPRTMAPATCRMSKLRHPVLAACFPDSSSALR
jgi:DNA-directed RNA polymerase specialized sigma24 family protein